MNNLNRIPQFGGVKRLSFFCILITTFCLGFSCIQRDRIQQDCEQLQIAYNKQFDELSTARNREKDLENVITQQIKIQEELKIQYEILKKENADLIEQNKTINEIAKELEEKVVKLEEEKSTLPSRGQTNKSNETNENFSNKVNKKVGWFKSYTNYKVLKRDPSYPTWQLQMEAHTDSRGFRRIGEYYLCAIGTGWGLQVKDKAIVYLSTGESFKMIMCDTKANAHTDSKNIYTLSDKSVVEFYIDKSVFKDPKKHGDVSKIYTEFSGQVINIVKI